MGIKKFAFVLALSLAALSSSHATVPSTAKAAEALPLHPVSLSATGNVIARVPQYDDVYAWDSNAGTQKAVYISEGAVNISYYGSPPSQPKIEVSTDGQTVLNYHSIYTPPYSRLVLMDQTNSARHVIPETRSINSIPRISPDGQSYAFSGRLDPNNYYQGQSLWTLDLSEYVWDLGWGIAQPTGYYLQTVYSGFTPARNTYANPDTIGGFAWSSDSQKLAYTLSKYDNRGVAKTALYIYDRASNTTEEVTSVGWTLRMDWPTADYIYFLTQQVNNNTGYSTYQLARLDIKKKTSENVVADSLDPYTYSISADGKYVVYSTYVPPTSFPAPQVTQPVVLHDVDNKTRVEISDAQSGSFGMADKLVLQKLKLDLKNSTKPFFVADVRDVLAAAPQGTQQKKLTMASLGSKVSEAGEAVVVYDPPTDSSEFGTEFQMRNSTMQISGTYFYGNMSFENVSKQYYKFGFKSYDIIRCTAYDDKGVQVGDNSAAFVPLPGGYENKLLLGPNKTTYSYCSGNLKNKPPVGTKGKVVIEFHGYESRGKYEAQIMY